MDGNFIALDRLAAQYRAIHTLNGDFTESGRSEQLQLRRVTNKRFSEGMLVHHKDAR